MVFKQILAPISETKNEAQTTESNLTESDFLNTNKPQNASSNSEISSPVKIVPIYSQILYGIQNLTLRKANSEAIANERNLTLGAVRFELGEDLDDDEDRQSKIYEEQILDVPELRLVKRLSCFEMICPNTHDDQFKCNLE